MPPPTPAIREARPADLGALGPIERAAASRFRAVGLDWLAEGGTLPEAMLEAALAARLLWVATDHADAAVGFLAAAEEEGWLFILEVSVLPAWQGAGLGRALIGVAAEEAGARRLAGLALTTYRDVPWNGPFYARCGFLEVPAASLTPGLAARLAEEAAHGHDPARRCAMRRPA